MEQYNKGDIMKIGIDIDDVLTDSSKIVKEYLNKYEKSGDGMKYIVEVMRGEMPTENIKKFFKEYIPKIHQNVEIKENAVETIDRLLNKGHEIILITTRGEERFKGSEKTTLDYLKKHNVKYTKIIFNSFEKQLDCKANNIDVMIDDSVKNCENIRKAGIIAFLYTSSVNKSINTDLPRVESWLEIEKVIDSLNKNK